MAGKAFSTLFTLALSDEIASNAQDSSQLTFNFGWKRKPSDDPNFVAQTRSSDEASPLSIEAVLPPGLEAADYNLIAVCKVCNEDDVCSQLETRVKVLPRVMDEKGVRY